jgi:hypothetical protein
MTRAGAQRTCANRVGAPEKSVLRGRAPGVVGRKCWFLQRYLSDGGARDIFLCPFGSGNPEFVVPIQGCAQGHHALRVFLCV